MKEAQPTVTHHAYAEGQTYRVTAEGCKLLGMRPITGGRQGWSRKLEVGEEIVCKGREWTSGDGVPIIKWLAQEDGVTITDCEFQPSVGGMWNSMPDSTKLEPVVASADAPAPAPTSKADAGEAGPAAVASKRRAARSETPAAGVQVVAQAKGADKPAAGPQSKTFAEDDPHLTFVPIAQASVPPSGIIEHHKDKWWISHPTRGLAFWKRGKGTPAPQCNSAESVTRHLARMYPWAEVVFVPSAFQRVDVREYA